MTLTGECAHQQCTVANNLNLPLILFYDYHIKLLLEHTDNFESIINTLPAEQYIDMYDELSTILL